MSVCPLATTSEKCQRCVIHGSCSIDLTRLLVLPVQLTQSMQNDAAKSLLSRPESVQKEALMVRTSGNQRLQLNYFRKSKFILKIRSS